jgi:hypothetical protein
MHSDGITAGVLEIREYRWAVRGGIEQAELT